MEETNKKHMATHSPTLTARVKREMISDVIEPQQHVDTLLPRTGMTPSGHNEFFPWIPCPLGQPVVPEEAIPVYNERRLNPHEWVELLEQTECLDYVSPDVEACIDKQSRMEGNQELELTGREFIDSPAIPKLPPLNAISTEHLTILKPITRSQRTYFQDDDVRFHHASNVLLILLVEGNVPRRPGLREQFPRQQPLTERNHVHFSQNYAVVAEYPTESKRPSRRSSATKRGTENPPQRSASRSLKFEAPKQPKTSTRRKRASWNGRPADATTPAPARRQCKSARKSKDCMIPGCTKGARSRGLCKRHGGGKRCTHPGCARSDQGGGFCIAHGGGKRCAIEGCKNSAQSRGLCKSHGGGKRCRAKGCTKSSQAGGFCRGHQVESVLV